MTSWTQINWSNEALVVAIDPYQLCFHFLLACQSANWPVCRVLVVKKALPLLIRNRVQIKIVKQSGVAPHPYLIALLQSRSHLLASAKAILQVAPQQSMDKEMVETGYSTLLPSWQWWQTTCGCWVCPVTAVTTGKTSVSAKRLDQAKRNNLACHRLCYGLCCITALQHKDNEELLGAPLLL